MLQALLPSILPAVTDIVGRFLPENKEERAKAEREIKSQLTAHLAKIDLAQLDINKAEAANRSIFVAGWRPFLGWGLASAMIWHFVLAPIVMFIFAYSGMEAPELPAFDMDSLMTVLLGMLGLGGLRTFEKSKGLAK